LLLQLPRGSIPICLLENNQTKLQFWHRTGMTRVPPLTLDAPLGKPLARHTRSPVSLSLLPHAGQAKFGHFSFSHFSMVDFCSGLRSIVHTHCRAEPALAPQGVCDGARGRVGPPEQRPSRWVRLSVWRGGSATQFEHGFRAFLCPLTAMTLTARGNRANKQGQAVLP
jgi:hypothetical protein